MTDQFHIVEYDQFQAQMDELKELANFIPDASNKEGYEKSKRIHLDFRKVENTIEKVRKERKAYFLQGGKEVDAQAKIIASKIAGLRLPHTEAYQEVDSIKKEREAKRVADLESRVEYIRTLPEAMADMDSVSILAAIEQIQSDECLDYQEFTERALKCRNESIDKLSILHSKKMQEEQEKAELERLRKESEERARIEREEQIKREAAAKAEAEKKAAEEETRRAKESEIAAKRKAEEAEAINAENMRIENHKRAILHIKNCGMGFIGDQPQPYGLLLRELEEKIVIDESLEEFQKEAEEARTEAISRIKKHQESERKKAEEAAEKARLNEVARQEAEAKRQAEELAAREANKKHIGAIRKAAKEGLMLAGLTEEQAKAVVLAIHARKIPNVKINY
jgi:hypothetical protein